MTTLLFSLLFSLFSLSSCELFTFSSNLGSISPDSFSHVGRGSQSVALGSTSEVTVRASFVEEGEIDLTVPLASFSPINEFGPLDLTGNDETHLMLFLSEKNKNESVVSLYSSEWMGADWSLRQTISPSFDLSNELADPPYYFGSKFAVDRSSFLTLAVGYGDASQFMSFPVGYGKICMYEAVSTTAKEWLPTQDLVYPFAVQENVIRMGGTFVNMHDDVLVTDTFSSSGYRMEIFSQSRSNGLWSHQQSLAPASSAQDVITAVVYEGTIVYSINDAGGSGADLIGKSSVHVMHPNTPQYSSSTYSRRLDSSPKAKPKAKSKPTGKDQGKSKPKRKPTPPPLRWNLVQTLWSPNHDLSDPSSGSDVGFGQDLSLYENTLVVSEVGNGTTTGFIYVFQRSSFLGAFTMLQTILPSIGSNSFLSAHRLNSNVLMASSILANDAGLSNDIWVGNADWECLIIRLEDAFGDGWDGARLRIETPSKAMDYYAPLCYANPLVFRYCPTHSADEGVYHMAIVDDKSARFTWEASWTIQEEYSGDIYRGDVSTKMDFKFENMVFTSTKIDHIVTANTTCSGCNGLPPKPKPKPKLPSKSKAKPSSSNDDDDKPKAAPSSRRLHPHTHTSAPTISPAPTLAVTSGVDNWSSFNMMTSGGDWFREDYLGTHFYISDTEGQKLYSAGTMCSGHLQDSCSQDLPDGQYTLRVTGDLNPYSDDNTWTFCGRLGVASDSLTFEISDGVCTPLLRLTTSDVCVMINPTSGIMAYEVALGSFIMAGTLSGDITAADISAFEHAVEQTIPGAVTGGVSLMGFDNDENNMGVVVHFSVQLSVQELGYNPLDYSSVSQLFSYENNVLASSVISQKMVGELSSGAQTFFGHIESVQLLSLRMGDIEFSKSPLESREQYPSDSLVGFDFSASSAPQDQAAEIKEFYSKLGVAGYVLAAASIAGLVVLVLVARRAQVSPHSQSWNGYDGTHASDDRADNSEVEVSDEEDTKGAAPFESKSSSRKSSKKITETQDDNIL